MTDKEQPTEEKVEEPKEEETEKEESDDSSTLISKANAAAERMEAANKKLESNLAVMQKMQVESTLSGKTTAGVKTKSKEDKDIEEAKRFLAGTGMEDYAFPEEREK